MSDKTILNSAEVTNLEMRLEEATRASASGVRRFIEPAANTLQRAISRSHHIVFGRRGSGKSSLLRKAAQDLTIDRRPIAFVDLESFKGHEYPDVLISVLIETLGDLRNGSRLLLSLQRARRVFGTGYLEKNRQDPRSTNIERRIYLADFVLL